MSEWSRGAAWWPRPRSLCRAAAWYVRAMYEQCGGIVRNGSELKYLPQKSTVLKKVVG
jgi:hypothetical protein